MNSELFQIVVLAVVQGIAEFLPISSSGHLVVLSALLNRNVDTAELTIVLHFGSLLAILVFYRKQLVDLLRTDRRIILPIVVGTLPAACVGLWIKMQYPGVLNNALLAGFLLVVTAFLLMALPRIPEGKRTYTGIGYAAAVLIGLAQAFALLPGVSRSGVTIVAGCLTGLQRQSAVTFSFLLAIPAIAGASVLEARNILEQGSQTPWPLLLCGALISFGVGWLALRWLVGCIEQGKLHLFAYWLVPLGFSIVIWQLYEMLQRNAAGG